MNQRGSRTNDAHKVEFNAEWAKWSAVKIAVDGEFELDDDYSRVDRDALWDFLSEKAYWQRWRSRADVIHQVDGSWRVLGVYRRDGGEMVGFARAMSDGSVAYLSDVYVDESVRGKGLGKALVNEMVTRDNASTMRWLLHTSDAHGLYQRFGFRAPNERLMERDPVNPRDQ